MLPALSPPPAAATTRSASPAFLESSRRRRLRCRAHCWPLRTPPTTLARHGFEFPLLIRTPGFHTGRHFLRVEAIAELPAALAELPGEHLTVLRYLDARGADGKVRKYRVMMIDGGLYPLHVAISSHWKIHYFTADMADNPEHRAEDAEFLENMPAVLGPRAMAALAEIQSRLGARLCGDRFRIERRRRDSVLRGKRHYGGESTGAGRKVGLPAARGGADLRGGAAYVDGAGSRYPAERRIFCWLTASPSSAFSSRKTMVEKIVNPPRNRNARWMP